MASQVITVGIVGGSDLVKIEEQLGSDSATQDLQRLWLCFRAARIAGHSISCCDSACGKVNSSVHESDRVDHPVQPLPHMTTYLRRTAWWLTRRAKYWQSRA